MNTKNKGSAMVIAIIIALIVGLAGGYVISKVNRAADVSYNGDNIAPMAPPLPNENTQAKPANATTPAKTETQANTPVFKSTLGFSTVLDPKLSMVSLPSQIGFNESSWSTTKLGVGAPLVFKYASDSKGTTNLGIVIYKQDDGYPECISKLNAPGDNKAGLAVYTENMSDAAMGHFEHIFKRGISNGTKSYCVMGFVSGSHPYNLEGAAYDEVENINEKTIANLKASLNIFVDNFQITAN